MSDVAPPAPATTTRDPRPALIAGAAVAAVLLLGSLVSLLETLGMQLDPRYIPNYFLPTIVTGVLPTAVGVFLLLWLWPVRAGDRMLMVLVKGLVAALAGVIASTIVSFIWVAISSGLIRISDISYIGYNPLNGLLSGVLDLAPLVMLVVLVQWLLGRGARL